MMRLTPAIHDALRRRCPRFMWASSMHALGTLPPTSIVFLAIPTLYMKDDDLRLCARLVSRARYAFCSHVPLPRPPFPPPTYSPAFAGRCARAASAFPRPVHDACDDDHRCRGRCQDRAGRLCTHSSSAHTRPSNDLGAMCATTTTTTQRCAAASRVHGVQRAQARSRSRPGTQSQSLENQQGGSGSGARAMPRESAP
ncbi:hypothetical protein DFH09DRAFT_1187325 [Mycena vulgaris]|nr:hypothetical protein DFH09DRAFT_1187325 [Mycena vulgaris]